MSKLLQPNRAAVAIVLGSLMLFAGLPVWGAQWAVLNESLPDGLASHSVVRFATAVSRQSGGSLVLSTSRAATKTTSAMVLGELSAGRLAMASVDLAALEAADPVVAMDRVPYLASNYVDGAKLWQVLQPYVRDALQSKGITLLYALPLPPPAPLSRKPLLQMSAWRDTALVINAPALEGFARALGSRAVGSAGARELLSAARAEVVFESAPAAVADKAWEYATDYLLAPAWFPKQLVVVSSSQLATLSAADRDVLLNAADAEQRKVWSASAQAHEDSVQKLRDYGIKTREPAVEVLIQLEALGRELLFQWSDAAGEVGAQLVAEYYAIR